MTNIPNPPMPERRSPRSWYRILLVAVGVFGVAAALMAFLFFGRWMNVEQVMPDDIALHFAAAIDEAGGGVPFIEIDRDGEVVVHREQKPSQAVKFDTLTLMAWAPSDEKMFRVDYPRWFVKLKTSTVVNLGTMIAAVRRDWEHLDLSVNYDDLLQRGPALLLDQTSAGGARVVIWTSAKTSQ